MKGKHHSKAIQARGKQMYLIGATSRDISEALGIADGTIRQWINRGKWVREREQTIRRAITVQEKAVNNLTARAIATHQELVQDTVTGLIGKISESTAKKPAELVQLATALSDADTIGRRNLGLSTTTSEERGSHQSINLYLGQEEPDRAIDVQVTPVDPQTS